MKKNKLFSFVLFKICPRERRSSPRGLLRSVAAETRGGEEDKRKRKGTQKEEELHHRDGPDERKLSLNLDDNNNKKLSSTFSQQPAADTTAVIRFPTGDDSQADDTFSKFADEDDKDLIGPEGELFVRLFFLKEERVEKTPTTTPPPPPKKNVSKLFQKKGVGALCSAMGLDPADRRVLFLAWLAGASRMGYFTRAEWARACRKLRAGLPTAVAAALAPLAASVDAPRSPDFPSFFEFAFRYCLTDASQKIIDLATAREMLSLALPPEGRCHHRQALLDFLGQQREYKCLNADQWRGIGRFVREVGPGCADFDDDGAWPLLLDNYVEWVRKGGGKANAEGVK